MQQDTAGMEKFRLITPSLLGVHMVLYSVRFCPPLHPDYSDSDQTSVRHYGRSILLCIVRLAFRDRLPRSTVDSQDDRGGQVRPGAPPLAFLVTTPPSFSCCHTWPGYWYNHASLTRGFPTTRNIPAGYLPPVSEVGVTRVFEDLVKDILDT